MALQLHMVPKRKSLFLLLPALLLSVWAPDALGLEELWHCDLVSGVYSLPLAADTDGNDSLEVQLTTRFDGALWQIDAHGAVVRHYPRANWLEGSLAASYSTDAPANPLEAKRSTGTQNLVVAFQESTGRANLLDTREGLNLWLPLEGEPAIGSAPCFADVNGDSVDELICARKDGTLTVFDARLTPLWQFEGDAPFESTPAAAPMFENMGAVYVQSVDGAVYCLSGLGVPLWRFRTEHPGSRFPSVSDLTVVQLAGTRPTLLISDAEGTLYGVDAVSGIEQWRTQAGTAALGSVALLDAEANEVRTIVVLSERGELALVAADGTLIREARLPSDVAYVPRPLVADVDGDTEPEVVVASRDWHIVVAGLDGKIEERIELRGNVREGLVLADLEGNGTLELLAATDCARLYCFATAATNGWRHPRGGIRMNGAIGQLPRSPIPSVPVRARRSAEPDSVVTGSSIKGKPFAAAVLDLSDWAGKGDARIVVRRGATVLGSAFKPVSTQAFTAPYTRLAPGQLALDVDVFDDQNECLASVRGVPIEPALPQPIRLTPPDDFLDTVRELGRSYTVPHRWLPSAVGGRDSWHVVRFNPERWRSYGIAEKPFIAEAIPRIWAPATDPGTLFGPQHGAWDAIKADAKPFFVMNEYFRPKTAYSDEAFEQIVKTGRHRFLGFPVHEWAYHTWKTRLEGAAPAAATREEATAILKADFDELMDLCHGKIYQGQGYGLFHHQAFAWGAPMGYAEVGENIPCAPLQFAFLRGASRQYGGRPWGAYLSNWFRGAVVDTRHPGYAPRVRWSPPSDATGPYCGHSASLEFRLAMAAHLAGATFVHHESDAHNGSIFVQEDKSESHQLSRFGEAIDHWSTYARQFPNRGIPFTPVAFLVDFHHGWRPREDIYGIWPRKRPDDSMEQMFAQVFPYGGRLDFERGYLANGPYGDCFDVITNDVTLGGLQPYGVVWPVGDTRISKQLLQALMEYVRGGGILVLDSALAQAFPARFLGLRFSRHIRHAAHLQTALRSLPPIVVPFRYRPLRVGRNAEALAWSGNGDAILAWHRMGRGVVITSGTDHWLDERNGLLPIAGALLEHLSSAFLPFQPSANVEMLLNKTDSGWIVGLINNDGITKVPVRPPVTDVRKTRECVLRFRERPPLQFVSRVGEFQWNSRADGIQTKLAPGAVAVVELKYSP